MNPEESMLLKRAIKLSEENNQILLKLQRNARLAFFWTLVKIAIVVVPLVLGYIYLSPHFNDVNREYQEFREVLQVLSR